jgi:hypothetical protein
MTYKTNITNGKWSSFEAGVDLPGTDGGHEVHSHVEGQLVMVAECIEGHFSMDYPDTWQGERTPDYHLSKAEALANAKAIAAVPDMIAALRATLPLYQSRAEQSRVAGMAIDALKKAGVML